jgi:hypothetical protein
MGRDAVAARRSLARERLAKQSPTGRKAGKLNSYFSFKILTDR